MISNICRNNREMSRIRKTDISIGGHKVTVLVFDKIKMRRRDIGISGRRKDKSDVAVA